MENEDTECRKLIECDEKHKTPMTTPNQIREVKRLLLAYNGEGVADYENILGFGLMQAQAEQVLILVTSFGKIGKMIMVLYIEE